jgi:hypothetical protein
MVLTQNLPLLDPLRAIPVIGNPLADLLQPDLRTLVNIGYGDPAYGYSTAPANVPTTFGLFPPINPGVLGGDLVTGAQQGFSAATSDLVAEGLTSPPGVTNSLLSLSLPSPTSMNGFVQSLPATIANIPYAVSKAATDAYSVLLPTADIANAAVISIPAYDAGLFANGIGQALGGDPVGLINAIGNPIAASTGLLTVSGGVEGLVLIAAAADVVKDLTSI